MGYGALAVGIAQMGMSIYAAQQKKILDGQAAAEIMHIRSETGIARHLTVMLKDKEFRRNVASIRKQGAYAKSGALLKGKQTESKLTTKLSTSGAKITGAMQGTTLDLRVNEALLTNYAMAMTEHGTFEALDDALHGYTDWKTASDFDHKTTMRRMKKKAELKRKGAMLDFATGGGSGVLGGIKTAGEGAGGYDFGKGGKASKWTY